MSSLSERFDALPEPEYNNLPIQTSADANGLKRRSTTTTANSAILYQEAAANQPQIIRPNVNNLTVAPFVAANKPIQLIPAVVMSSNNGVNRAANKANYVAKKNMNMRMNGHPNRGRGFKNNYAANGHAQQRRQAPPPQPQHQASGYRAYRTSTVPRQSFNHSPYKRPPTVQQKARELPAYPNHVFHGNQSQNHNHNNYRNNNGFRNNRVNNNHYVPRANANNFRPNRAFNQNQNQYNNNFQYKANKTNGFNNNNNNFANRRNKFNNNTNRGNNAAANGGANFAFNKKGKLSEESLDRELDAYLMKNPDAEARQTSMNANLDKELDDYWKTGQSEGDQKQIKKAQPSTK